MSNTIVYQEDWETKLQERLNHNNTWKEVCEVIYTDTKTLHRPYDTDPAVQTGATRGSAYTYQDITNNDDSVAIDTYDVLPVLIDRADLAQSQYNNQMILAERQGRLIDERLETAMLAQHAQWTDFDNASIGGGAGNITVTVSNIDDIVSGILREIREANGQDLMDRNGAFIIWRAADFEKLEAFARANGFSMADAALKNGLSTKGVFYMGAWHYSSNKHASGHLFAGVRKAFTLGICRSTYGKVVVVDEPTTGSGNISGIGVVSRVDYKFEAWVKVTPVLFDVLVA